MIMFVANMLHICKLIMMASLTHVFHQVDIFLTRKVMHHASQGGKSTCMLVLIWTLPCSGTACGVIMGDEIKRYIFKMAIVEILA